jgi:ketosteroid isomerase-like protein
LSATLLALPPAVHSQEVDGEIRAEVTRYVQTVNRADADALAALYLRDPTTGSLGDGQVYQGWETIAELLTEVYDAVGTIQMTIDSVTVLPLGGVGVWEPTRSACPGRHDPGLRPDTFRLAGGA